MGALTPAGARPAPRRRRRLLLLDAGLKLALLGLLLFAVSRPDLAQFQGKAIAARAIGYPVAVLLVPAIWWLAFRRRPYPYALDILWTLPFVIDTAGNAANLYDTIGWWDDANHAVNWVIVVLAAGVLLVRARLPRWVTFGLSLGFGAVTHICWELIEYAGFIRGNQAELATAYRDTIGDLGLSLLGSLIGASVTSVVLRRGAGGGSSRPL
ncbi:MAG: hypothetical protein IT201_08395 [Thermoleophilia bacterium]|nr:hypothetical protein [Thermoleophilia bacterium]